MHLSSLIDRRLPVSTSSCIPLAILTGEGIGPEVIEACAPILAAIESFTNYRFDVEYGGKIGAAAYSEYGTPLTDEVIAFCQRSFERGAPLFCGPGGHRFVYELRKHFDIFCKFVPLRPLPSMEDTGVIRPEVVRNTDILLLRENVGGLYQGSWHTEETPCGPRAHQSFSYDRAQVARIMRIAFGAAESRKGSLCVVHKPGGAPAISELWVDVAREFADASSVALRFLEVDTAGYLILADPASFDVMVSPNMFGDIIGDVAALLLGSRGMSYSFNVGARGKAVYQTAHGAAYDMAGQQTANPLGQVQSLAVMLKEHFGLAELSRLLLAACDEVLASGLRTADIMCQGGTLTSTRDMGNAVAEAYSRKLSVMQAPAASALNS